MPCSCYCLSTSVKVTLAKALLYLAGGGMTQTSQEQPLAYRWVILAAACIIGFMLVGARETLGNFLKPITEELHWDRETISLIAAINLWLSGLLQPFTGHIMDRFGAKWLFASSVAVYGLGVLLV